MAARRGTANRHKRSGGVPAWFLLLGGILIGLCLAGFMVYKGYLPDIQRQTSPADEGQPAVDSEALLREGDVKPSEPSKPRYDFFTVLPEMEVAVPEQELSREAAPVPGGAADNYTLQAGSFRSPADAEQLKARLALLGSAAAIQMVTVNGETWHRVRIGPLEGARKADEVRRLLAENGIETLVLKVNP